MTRRNRDAKARRRKELVVLERSAGETTVRIIDDNSLFFVSISEKNEEDVRFGPFSLKNASEKSKWLIRELLNREKAA